jgi:hypothetical protein
MTRAIDPGGLIQWFEAVEEEPPVLISLQRGMSPAAQRNGTPCVASGSVSRVVSSLASGSMPLLGRYFSPWPRPTPAEASGQGLGTYRGREPRLLDRVPR